MAEHTPGAMNDHKLAKPMPPDGANCVPPDGLVIAHVGDYDTYDTYECALCGAKYAGFGCGANLDKHLRQKHNLPLNGKMVWTVYYNYREILEQRNGLLEALQQAASALEAAAKKHCGPRAVECAEEDLLGEALAACKTLVDVDDSGKWYDDDLPWAAVDAARAVLAKATPEPVAAERT